MEEGQKLKGNGTDIKESSEEGGAAPESPPEDPSKKSARPGENMGWYVIHTYSGFENQVRDSLKERMIAHGYQDKMDRILIPTERVVEIKRGKKKESTRKFFSGYLLIEAELTEEVKHLIRSTPRVTGFLGDRNNPPSLREEEVQSILDRIEGVAAKKPVTEAFSKGENVKVIEGPFTDFSGTVEEVLPDRGKLKVMVSIFGRTTPVELDFLQVEKI